MHLRDTRDRILRSNVPWAAKASAAVLVGYRDVSGSGELTFQAQDAGVVGALHAWFNALAADPDASAVIVAHRHGRDLLPGK